MGIKAKLIGTFANGYEAEWGKPILSYSTSYRDDVTREQRFGEFQPGAPVFVTLEEGGEKLVDEYVELASKIRKLATERDLDTTEAERQAEIEKEGSAAAKRMQAILDLDQLKAMDFIGAWFELTNCIWEHKSKTEKNALGELEQKKVFSKDGTPIGRFLREDVMRAPAMEYIGKAEQGLKLIIPKA